MYCCRPWVRPSRGACRWAWAWWSSSSARPLSPARARLALSSPQASTSGPEKPQWLVSGAAHPVGEEGEEEEEEGEGEGRWKLWERTAGTREGPQRDKSSGRVSGSTGGGGGRGEEGRFKIQDFFIAIWQQAQWNA